MNKDEVYKLIEANGLTLHGDIEHFAALVSDHIYAEYLEQPEPKQSGMISITAPAPIAYLCENAVGHKYFRWKKPSSTYKPIALYTTPPAQRTWVGLTVEEKNEITWGKTIYEILVLFEAKLKEKNATAQPAVPDAIGPNEDELPSYAAGWNDCRALMLEMRKP